MPRNGEICSFLGLATNNATQYLRKLEALGYVSFGTGYGSYWPVGVTRVCTFDFPAKQILEAGSVTIEYPVTSESSDAPVDSHQRLADLAEFAEVLFRMHPNDVEAIRGALMRLQDLEKKLAESTRECEELRADPRLKIDMKTWNKFRRLVLDLPEL